MGTISTKDTRRISFDNTFAIIPVITVHKSIEDNTFAEIENIVDETENESILKNQTIETHGYNENDYWTRRLDHLKKEHNSINKIIESEYEKTIENTNQIFEPLKVTHDRIHKMKPCFEWRAKVQN
ncbi:uncharacterized protein LOC113518302 [Galleria mellonella]|uniref:Uncharacterized protein LOC113518302 n=1 Tax=Galleria mellonella TaxID=7137 RepID=A0ABM3N605_GALME|nr:uncharacterized protein LOC113518302 [Galleria mellonella]